MPLDDGSNNGIRDDFCDLENPEDDENCEDQEDELYSLRRFLEHIVKDQVKNDEESKDTDDAQDEDDQGLDRLGSDSVMDNLGIFFVFLVVLVAFILIIFALTLLLRKNRKA